MKRWFVEQPEGQFISKPPDMETNLNGLGGKRAVVSRRPRGFTLIELLVTMGIITIIVTLVMAVVVSAFRTVKTVEGRTDAHQRARSALNYVKNRVAEAVSFHIGWQRMQRSVNRTDVDPQWNFCDWRGPDPLNLTPDGQVDFNDLRYQPDPVNDPTKIIFIADPHCWGDPDLEFTPFNPQTGAGFPDANLMGDDLNQQNRDTNNGRRYRMGYKDLNGNGSFEPVERFVRTLTLRMDAPFSTMLGQRTCPQGSSRVERQDIVLDFSFRPKTFWDDANLNGRIDGVNPANPLNSGELFTLDFVLYERRTRFFEDTVRNSDLNCDGVVNTDPASPNYDERMRTIEIPITRDLLDIHFHLYDSDGRIITPSTAPIEITNIPGYPRSTIGPGLFACTYYYKRWNPIQNAYEWVGPNYDVFCKTPVKLEIQVYATSDDMLKLIRETRDVYYRPYLNLLPSIDPKKIGALDYMGLTPYASLYTPGNLVVLSEVIDLSHMDHRR
ncbi:MAG: PilW family protein [bacterium JZ-2024 1]